MDLRRWKAGEWITAISAVALGVSLFLPWYSLPEAFFVREGASVDRIPTENPTGWEIFSIIDVLLFALAIGAIVAVLRAADGRSISQGLFGEGLIAPFALVMSIVVLIRFLNIPGDLEPVKDAVSRGAGAWIGLFATFGILIGDGLAMRNEWIGSRPMPEIETLPAPSRDSAPA